MPIVYYIWYTNICITTTGGIFNLLLLFHVYPRLIRGCCGLAAKRDSRGRPGGRRQDPGEISLGQLPAGRRGAAHGAQGAAGRILAAAAVYRVYVHCLSTPRVQIIKVNSSRPPRRRAWRPGWPGPPAGSWRVPGQLPAGRRGAARGAQGAACRILAGSPWSAAGRPPRRRPRRPGGRRQDPGWILPDQNSEGTNIPGAFSKALLVHL